MTAPAASQVRFGELPHARHLPAGASDSVAAALADVDRDGDRDLIVLRSDGVTQIYRNDGAGRFDAAGFTAIKGGAGEYLDLAVGDVDRNGSPDLVILVRDTSDGSRMRLYLNQGAGSFRNGSSQWMPTSPRSMSRIELVDLNGDGWRDIVAGSGSSGSRDRVYLNQRIRFASTSLWGESGETRDIATGDVDGDGDVDMLTVGRREPQLYLNDGSGLLSSDDGSAFPGSGGGGDRCVALGDLDGDGDLDALIASWQGIRLFINRSGVFTDETATHMPPDGRSSRDLILADLDADQDLDMVVLSGRGGRDGPIWTMTNDGAAGFKLVTMPLAPDYVSMNHLAVGDVDGDGDQDVFAATEAPCDNCEAPSDWLFVNDGDGRMAPAVVERVSRRDGIVDCLAVADVDGDRQPDLFVGSRTGSWLMLGDQVGGFELGSETMLPPLPGVISAAAFHDFDADGDADLLLAVDGGANALMLNGGDGNFVMAAAGRIPVRSNPTASVAIGDLDGDGDYDAVFANRNAPNSLYRYSAERGFEDDSAGSLPVTVEDSRSVVMGDIDGDGDLDLVFGNFGWSNQLLLNNGRGQFVDATAGRLLSVIDDTVRIAIFDMDGDRDLDLLFGNGERLKPAQDRLLLNDGKGVFTELTSSNLPSCVCETRALTVLDYDEDGDLDMFAAAGFDGENGSRLLENDGLGRFRDVSAEALGAAASYSARGVQAFDVDWDGDQDLVVLVPACPDVTLCGLARPRVLLNLNRQIASPYLLRGGEEWVLEFYATPSKSARYLAMPWLSLRRAFRPVDFPSMGRLWLSRSAMVALPAQALDAETGRGELRFDAPALPGLVGLPLYTQAALVDLSDPRPKLSNLLVDVYSD